MNPLFILFAALLFVGFKKKQNFPVTVDFSICTPLCEVKVTDTLGNVVTFTSDQGAIQTKYLQANAGTIELTQLQSDPGHTTYAYVNNQGIQIAAGNNDYDADFNDLITVVTTSR